MMKPLSRKLLTLGNGFLFIRRLLTTTKSITTSKLEKYYIGRSMACMYSYSIIYDSVDHVVDNHGGIYENITSRYLFILVPLHL
jgi:hypothetical protein